MAERSIDAPTKYPMRTRPFDPKKIKGNFISKPVIGWQKNVINNNIIIF